ncbi:MAG: ATP-binding cassette domain-containing protein [Sulfurovaceae bacterium]|nr:ATP-binding cassette domain-containing protein [Sulfurovaceae bacterium]
MIYIDVQIDLNMTNGKKEASYKLQIQKNEFITLFGDSGAGKTTLLRLIAGLENPKSGKIIVDDRVWFDSEKNINLSPQKREVGFVFQDYALFPNMNIQKNLLYACQNESQKANIPKLLSLVELESLSDSYPHQLSGGQKQRVALARALICEPKILLLDEPLSALDNKMRENLQNELLTIHKEFKIPALLVSHDVSETIKLSDRVAVVEHGKITNIDKPIKIFSKKNENTLQAEIIEINENESICKLAILVGTSIIFIEVEKDEARSYKVGQKIAIDVSKVAKDN